MELAIVAIIIAAVVLLLQVVSLALTAGMRKSINNLKDARPSPITQTERFEKRNADFRRHEKRPNQDQRHQAPTATPAAAVSIDPVEKSLRDINMRLKHAERDQEFARRKMQENFSRGDHPRNRDDRNLRGNRDRNRDNNRNLRRDNLQERNRYNAPQQQPAPSAVSPQPSDEPVFEKGESVPLPEFQAPVQQTDMERKPVAAAPSGPDLVPSDYSSDENLEHGRKTIVKRRMLKDELPEGSPAGVAEAPVSEAEHAPAPPPPPAENPGINSGTTPETEIRFGRR